MFGSVPPYTQHIEPKLVHNRLLLTCEEGSQNGEQSPGRIWKSIRIICVESTPQTAYLISPSTLSAGVLTW